MFNSYSSSPCIADDLIPVSRHLFDWIHAGDFFLNDKKMELLLSFALEEMLMGWEFSLVGITYEMMSCHEMATIQYKKYR